MSCWSGRRVGVSFGKAWRGSRVPLVVTAVLVPLAGSLLATLLLAACSGTSPGSAAAPTVAPSQPAPVYTLAALLDGPAHGYGIIKRAHALCDGHVCLTAGAPYATLDRLVHAVVVSARLGRTIAAGGPA